VSVFYLAQAPDGVVVADAIIHAFLFGIIGYLLGYIFRYGNYESLPGFQRITTCAALGLLSIVVWAGIGLGGIYLLFGSKTVLLLVPTLPVRVLIAILVNIILAQYYIKSVKETRNALDDEILSEKKLIREETDDVVAPEKPDNEPAIERISVKSGQKIHVILVPDIIYLQADGDYVFIFTADGKYLKEQTMKYFEEHLPTNKFVRIHRSYIVNVEAISRIELYEKQNQVITMKNGHHVKASQTGYKNLRKALNL